MIAAAPVAAPPVAIAPPPVAAAAPPVAASPVASPPARPVASPPAAPPSALAQAALPDDDSALLIPRGELEEQLVNIAQLGTQATALPARGGGFHLAAVRPGSYLESLGLRTGDVVRRIDGRPINSVDDAARACAWLRVADHFTVEVVRNGAPVQLRFQIADREAGAGYGVARGG